VPDRTPQAATASRPAYRDDRERPSMWGGIDRNIIMFEKFVKRPPIFCLALNCVNASIVTPSFRNNSAMTPIIKSVGATQTERLLAQLCERSFLKLWSYPSPVKDDRKELCDLLAVFEDHVFIFFDRENRQLDNTSADPKVNWERWKRKVIQAQMKTADGAERYIKSGREIFLDTNLTTKFPIKINLDKIIVHKIIVAHGASDACKNASADNVSGSLAIAYGDRRLPSAFPFLIDIEKNNPLHVFDSSSLPIIFGELDTVFDFAAFLDAKLEAVAKYGSLVYCGEEDLLAHYWYNYDEKQNRYRIGVPDPKINFIMIGEGEWADFIKTDIYKRKKSADLQSYYWDWLIQKTCENALNGRLMGHASFVAGESAMHEMAKEPRFSRRALSSHIEEKVRDFPENDHPFVRHVTLMPSFFENKAYVFLQLKIMDKGDYEKDYRPRRQAILELACAAAKNKFPKLKTVIGIAIDAPKYSRIASEDFCLMDCSDWSDERRIHYEERNRDWNFFQTKDLKCFKKRNSEFPEPPQRAPKTKTGRNDLCPCGSGNKFKRCCGKRAI
jgi:hypothetical protein